MVKVVEPLRARMARRKPEEKTVSIEKLQAIEEAFAPPEELGEILEDESIQPELRTSIFEFMSTLNFMNVISQFLLSHPDPSLQAHADRLDKANEEYVPQGPPISPVTTSHFNCWTLMDAEISPEEGTLCDAVLRLGPELGLDGSLSELLQQAASTRMGMYCQVGVEDKVILLREILTNRLYRVRCNSDYLGDTDTVWFVRLFPSRVEEGTHFIISTPYIVAETTHEQWVEYFGRNGLQSGASNLEPLLANFMKVGSSPNHWLEYIFEGYMGHRGSSCICLTGIPDCKESLPHSN